MNIERRINKVLDKMDWLFIETVVSLMRALEKPCPDGSMKNIGKELLKDLMTNLPECSEVSTGLLVARRYRNERGKEQFSLSFEPEEGTTEY